MQPHLPFSRDPLASSSKLGATLVRLQHHLEANQQREQAALERFESFEHETATHRDVISERLDSLNLELGQLVPITSGPRLSLVGQDSEQGAAEPDDVEHEGQESATLETPRARLASDDSSEIECEIDCEVNDPECGGTVSFLDFSRGRAPRAE